MKKVCFVSSYSCIGGAERSFQSMVSGYIQRGGEAFVILGEKGPLFDWCVEKCIDVFILKQPSLKKGSKIQSIFNLFCFFVKIFRVLFLNKCSIVHTNTLRSRLYCAPLFFLHYVRLIAHVRDIEKLTINKYLVKLYNTTVVISNAVKKSIEDDCDLNDFSKVKLIYNGVPDYIHLKSKIETSCYKNQNQIVIGMLGRFDRWKCQHVFVLAAIKLLDQGVSVNFLLYGDAIRKEEEDYKKEVLLLIPEKYNKRIVYMGFSNEPETIISNFNLLVCPSDNEPFGRVVIEAMSSGTSVIGSNNGGIPEILGVENSDLMFEANSIDALADKILFYLSNYSYFKVKTDLNYRIYKDKFSEERLLRELSKLYE